MDGRIEQWQKVQNSASRVTVNHLIPYSSADSYNITLALYNNSNYSGGYSGYPSISNSIDGSSFTLSCYADSSRYTYIHCVGY